MRDSYWFRRHDMQIEGCKREIVRIRAIKDGLGLVETEYDAMIERDRVQAALKGAVNAAKRVAQKEWSGWENTHMGARWAKVVKEIWPAWLKAAEDIWGLERDLEAMENPAEGVWPTLTALGRLGLVEEPVSKDSPLRLTALGTMATEVNEGHSILMPLIFQQRIFHALTGEEILVCLAAFLGEAKSDERPASVSALDIPAKTRAALGAVERLASASASASALDKNTTYWAINTGFVEPVWRWLDGATMADLSSTYALYEGNILRILLKLVNILEEWRNLATLAADTDMLERMRGLETTILRGVAVCDSLYLRL